EGAGGEIPRQLLSKSTTIGGGGERGLFQGDFTEALVERRGRSLLILGLVFGESETAAQDRPVAHDSYRLAAFSHDDSPYVALGHEPQPFVHRNIGGGEYQRRRHDVLQQDP